MVDRPGEAARGVSLRDLAQRIRRIARDHPDIAFRPHAREQAILRGITPADVLLALKGCMVVGMDRRGGAWRYRALGKTTDTTLGVVIEIEEESLLRVVTLWKQEGNQ